jgi:1-deoxy-D-xylulose-5-phosphate synthase
VRGGFGSAVREILDGEGRYDIRFKSIGLPIEIYPVGKADEICRAFHLDADGLTEEFRALLRS